MNNTHSVFSDESNWNSGRYRTICLVSLENKFLSKINQEIRGILDSSGISTFKWKHFDSARYRFCAEKILTYVFSILELKYIRIDVIVWDITDSRHTVKNRDDIANLERMYFHILRNVLKNKWPNEATWSFIPDNHKDINWNNLHEILSNVSVGFKQNFIFDDFQECLIKENEKNPMFIFEKYFHIYSIVEGKDENEPLLQIADFIAGLVSFSWETYDKYELWLSNLESTLFENLHDDKSSNRDKERFPVLKFFDEQCKKEKLRISLKTHRGLISKEQYKNMNIWFYKPQKKEDKAPTKARK